MKPTTLAYIEQAGVKYYVWHGPRDGLRRKVQERIESLGLAEDMIHRVQYKGVESVSWDMLNIEELI